jgi:Head domain of trimeric autotransporter adhesin
VGINTTTPAAILHVKDSSVLFTGIPTLPITPGNPPVSGAGTRMMWYPDKAAFRLGRVTDESWDKDSIGNYSFAAGQNVKAKGNFSAAFGNTSTALGVSSFATGFASQANGDFSVAMGYATEASGMRSIAFGSDAIASGPHSISIGNSTTASGINSISLGELTQAIGENSTAMGYSTESYGDYSIAMGFGSATQGSASFATGLGSFASGENSAAFGSRTISRSFASLVIGRYNDSIATSSKLGWVDTDPVFIIGNGTSHSTRSNALIVLKNGNTGIGMSNPAEKLVISGKTVTTDFQMTNGAGTNKLLESSTNGTASWTDDVVLDSIATNKLTVSGKTTTANFQMTNGSAVNTILQGNAGGNASWTNSPSITTLNSVNVNATYYNYLGPQTRYFNIPASGFQLMPVNGSSTAGLSSSTINGGQTLLTGTAGVISRFEAPIYLPEDAVIKSILLYVRDASGSYEVSADLIEVNALTQTIVASVPGTGVAATPNDTNISITGLTIPTSNTSAYFLRFNTIEFNGNLRVYNGRITYTVDKAD